MLVTAMLVMYNEIPCLKSVTCAKCIGNAEVTDLMSRLLCNDAHCTLKLIQIPYCPSTYVMHPESLADMM